MINKFSLKVLKGGAFYESLLWVWGMGGGMAPLATPPEGALYIIQHTPQRANKIFCLLIKHQMSLGHSNIRRTVRNSYGCWLWLFLLKMSRQMQNKHVQSFIFYFFVITLKVLSFLNIQWRQTRWCHCSTCTTTFMPSPKFYSIKWGENSPKFPVPVL